MKEKDSMIAVGGFGGNACPSFRLIPSHSFILNFSYCINLRNKLWFYVGHQCFFEEINIGKMHGNEYGASFHLLNRVLFFYLFLFNILSFFRN